ncbi:hypothetical protein Hanom_Chr08g00740731 [Helianthus anomalus]
MFNELFVQREFSSFDTKRAYRAGGSHWKQSLYSYGIEVRLSTSYPPQTLS